MNSQERKEVDEQQQLQLGQMAIDAANNPILGIILETIKARSMQAIDAAPPDHTKEVMWHKTKRMVVDEFIMDIHNLVQHAEKIYLDMQKRNSPEEKERRRLDTQGFGINYGKGGTS